MSPLTANIANIASLVTGGYSLSSVSTSNGLLTISAAAPNVIASMDGFGSIIVDTSMVDLTNTQITMNNRPIFETEMFKKCQDLYVSEFKLDGQSKMHFHALIWEKIFGNQITDYGTVFRPNDGIYLAFGSADSRNRFNRWVFDYSRAFFRGEKLAEQTIPVARQGRIEGSFVPDVDRTSYDPIVINNVRSIQFNDWVWIAANCNYPVYRFGAGWLFEKDAEAVYFKMRPD